MEVCSCLPAVVRIVWPSPAPCTNIPRKVCVRQTMVLRQQPSQRLLSLANAEYTAGLQHTKDLKAAHHHSTFVRSITAPTCSCLDADPLLSVSAASRAFGKWTGWAVAAYAISGCGSYCCSPLKTNPVALSIAATTAWTLSLSSMASGMNCTRPNSSTTCRTAAVRWERRHTQLDGRSTSDTGNT